MVENIEQKAPHKEDINKFYLRYKYNINNNLVLVIKENMDMSL